MMYSAGDESGDSTVRLLPRRADPDAIRRSQYEFPKDRRPEKVPYRSIGLAVSLFFIGSVLLVIGSLLVSGTIIPEQYADRTIPVLLIGLLAFIPGAYHTRLAWYAYHRYQGYSYHDLPGYDD